ncbi:hypothetical protein D3C72_1473220 [compost metagenome]
MRHGGGTANTQRAGRRIVKRVQLFVHLAHFQQHATTTLVIDFSGFRQANAAGAAVKQFNLQLILQFGDGLADRRNAHIELARRRSK